MRVALGSMFRNSEKYLGRYFVQVQALWDGLAWRGDSLRLILAEGDSRDDTWDRMAEWVEVFETDLFKREHGGPEFGSVNNPVRWQQVSWVCNGVMERVKLSDDVMIWVESDLIWQPSVLLTLLDRLAEVPAVAPMSFYRQPGWFYDIWGYRIDGQLFQASPPYHPALADWQPGDSLPRLDSAGSCIAMRGDVARCARFGPDDGVLGLGRSIWQHDYSLWLDPELAVIHP